jgi:hypothetical protein
MSESKTAARGGSHISRWASRHAPRPERGREDESGAGAEDPNEEYADAFARVRLVHAWVGAAAALVGLLMAFVALFERLTR